MSEWTPSQRVVFVDTSAFLAIASPRDAYQERARRIRSTLAEAGWHFLTTYFVVAELHALAMAREGTRFAVELIDDIESGVTSIIEIRGEDWERARSILRRYQDKDFSMTDALSFAVMERLTISVAFTFDRHFVQYGLQIADEQIS